MRIAVVMLRSMNQLFYKKCSTSNYRCTVNTCTCFNSHVCCSMEHILKILMHSPDVDQVVAICNKAMQVSTESLTVQHGTNVCVCVFVCVCVYLCVCVCVFVRDWLSPWVQTSFCAGIVQLFADGKISGKKMAQLRDSYSQLSTAVAK